MKSDKWWNSPERWPAVLQHRSLDRWSSVWSKVYNCDSRNLEKGKETLIGMQMIVEQEERSWFRDIVGKSIVIVMAHQKNSYMCVYMTQTQTHPHISTLITRHWVHWLHRLVSIKFAEWAAVLGQQICDLVTPGQGLSGRKRCCWIYQKTLTCWRIHLCVAVSLIGRGLPNDGGYNSFPIYSSSPRLI